MNKQKAKILIVGAFHMGSSTDMIQMNIDNMLFPKRQTEIENVIEKLKLFKPNKVAVEITKENDIELNNSYQKFLNNSLELDANEVHQIGFRLSARMGNEKVYPIDWMGDVGHRDIGDVLGWAGTNQPELYRLITEEYVPKIECQLKGRTILEMFIHINQEERIQIDHEMYMQIARIGEGTNYIGIDWLRWWYQRNLTNYSNLTKLIEDSNDRILLLIGAAHLHLVTQFLRESGLFEVESALHYLH